MNAETVQLLTLFLVLVAVLVLSMGFGRSETRAADRAREVVREVKGGTGDDQDEANGLHAKAGSLMVKLGNRLPLFNPEQRRKLQNQMLTAGFRHTNALSIFISIKLSCGLVGSLGGFAIARSMENDEAVISGILVLGGLLVGMMLPDMALRRRVTTRRRAIHRSLPDALDLLVICTNAGYSLSSSIKRLGIEMKDVCEALANELEITAHEIQMNADPVEGLRHLADRTGVESLRSLVATLIQAHQYGTPITQSLKTLARSERTTRILSLEEKGAKLAAKLTMPMMLLILPAVMLIAGGPAALRIMEVFK
ncbi:MAG: type II secretion system F family protein [Bacteroidota bacterium]